MKAVGIPEGYHKNLREKREFPKGLMQNNGKFQGVMIKLNGNPGGQLQKLISSPGGGGICFLSKPKSKTRCCFVVFSRSFYFLLYVMDVRWTSK